MHRISTLALRALAFGIATLLAVALISPAFAQNGGPLAAPPNSKPYGKSYAEWSAAWWQWAYSLPAAGHPLFDETGADAATGQSGPVWYLGGVFNVSGTAHRTITVPKGTALFFPIINAEWDDVCPPDNLTVEQLQALVASMIDLVTDLSCEVDGVSVPNLFQYRAAYAPFSITFPDGNLCQFFGGSTPAGTWGPVAADGYYLMLGPLSKGHHTLHFSGTVGPPISFTLDITYDITVVDRNAASATAALSPMSKPALARAMSSIRTPFSPSAATIGQASMAPNPTRGGGTLSFSLSKPGPVDVRLYDVSGRVVRVLSDHQVFSAGSHQLRVDRNAGDPLTPGMYFYRVTTGDGKSEGRMIVIE